MIHILCFSPTGTTKEASMLLAGLLNEKNEMPITLHDVTCPESRNRDYSFESFDLLIAACPTYAGRVPNKIMPFFYDHVKGNGCRCVCLVTYGNRSEDSSLAELMTLMKDNECRVIGACALVSRHTMSNTLASDRMDDMDRGELQQFGIKLKEKMKVDSEEIPVVREIGPYYTPLREDGENAVFLKAKTKVDGNKCSGCGRCSEVCPVGSIAETSPFACEGICIKCQACIRSCEKHARYFDDPDFLSHVRMLEKNYSTVHAKNKFFL